MILRTILILILLVFFAAEQTATRTTRAFRFGRQENSEVQRRYIYEEALLSSSGGNRDHTYQKY